MKPISMDAARGKIISKAIENNVDLDDAQILADLVEIGVMKAYETPENLLFQPAHPDLIDGVGEGMFTLGVQS
tara:strand:+ start:462 stop:680 length:219 start_codon:yes stop_codon:yes gene_type:complete